ncbi:aminopeptidase P family protein [Pseudenhygromyxa sp. WMMC2535]|uniref:aminopeptidase P family protein n=1 Tax=Pseudenhygromyxa sp. WMMC2535 TaxID=2712867 RepID=UPI001557D98D|nr:aminopeptidase P family protein [Pseudenhygromyxa sp. WMMC2535]NVB38283.1 aminopeptidase P family protein [Pseudenhygromyxa sp. WMMC2535]
MSHGLPPQSAEIYTARRRRLAAATQAPALLFSGSSTPRNYPANVHPFRPDSHFLYLTGAWVEGAALLVDGERSVLFMPAEDPADLIWHGPTPGWAEFQAATGVDEIRDIETLAELVQTRGAAQLSSLPAVSAATRFSQGRLLDRDWAEPGSTPKLGERDAALADAIIGLRMVHDAGALEMLRGAAEATVAAHLAGMAATRPGLRESDVRAAMEAPFIARDMTTAYGAIVTVHGEILHSTSYGHALEAGDLLLADVGAENHGWAGDVTRTWPVSGKFSPTQRAMYELVLASQQAAIDMLAPGVRYRDVHLAAGRVILQGLVDEGVLKGEVDGLLERGAQGLFFVHGLGHLLGLDVHDMEDLGDRAGYAPGRTRAPEFGLCFLRLDRDLQPGMAVTIEPGFYQVPALLAPGSELTAPFDADGSLDREALAKFADVRGIRIEDDVVITETGAEVLTAALIKAPGDVEAAVGQR